MRFEDERVVVVGAGVSGTGAARAFKEEGAQVLVTDRRPRPDLAAADDLDALGVPLASGGHAPEHFNGASLVYVSPGVPPESEALTWARSMGVPIWGELELGARLCRAPYIAVTGTNGKTTTAGMVTAILRAAGIDAGLCGNAGYPFPLAARERREALVVEASSFQLAFQESFHPRVSVILNLAPDHLDWHGTFDAYAGAKARVFRRQRADDVHVGNLDDLRAADVSMKAPCRIVWFGSGEPSEGDVGFVGERLVSRIDGAEGPLANVGSELPGYRADAAAAAAAAIGFGVPAEAVAAGLGSFTPEPHRGEVVAVADGVRFVDNSKATNVHAALAAIASVREGVLIAGGRAKGVDLSPLLSAAKHLRGVVAIGESGPELIELFDGTVPVRTAGSIEEAVGLARALAAPGGVVLLAPACASWDQFRDYAERGDRFARAARRIAEGDRASA